MQFTFFPYFPSCDFDLKIGRVHLFNFWKYKDNYIGDDAAKAILEKICRMYRKPDLELADNLTVCIWDGDYTFGKLGADEMELIRKYALSLLFCSVVKNSERGSCSSEHFDFRGLEFDYTERHINYSAGSFFRYSKTIWEMEEKKFVAPEYVETPSIYRYDKELLEALVKFADFVTPEATKVFLALNWVRNACMNFDLFSPESRAVMLATAFEIYFNLPERLKGVELAERLERCLGKDTKVLPIALTKRVQKNKKKPADIDFSVYGKWALDFYELRSKIVHGNEITKADWVTAKAKPHIVVALLMMRFCLHRFLAENGLLAYSGILTTFGHESAAQQEYDQGKIAEEIEKWL
jgi:Apea-like HEPN